jgi:hypothetical protein
MRFYDFMAVSVKSAKFWGVTTYSVVDRLTRNYKASHPKLL